MTRGNGQLDLQHGLPSERSTEVGMLKPAWPQFDLTPEVFRRFMTYESAFASDDIPQSASYHLLTSTSDSARPNSQLASSFVNVPSQIQGTGRRLIRGVPRKADANAPTTASSARSASSRSHSSAHIATSPSTSVRPPSESHHAVPQMQSGSLASQSLAQYFEQLKVSAKEQRPSAPQTLSPSQQQSQQKGVESRSTTSPSKFSFLGLPANLTDDGYNHRHRAAQFILLYSQQANSEELSLCKRLSLPLRRDASGLFKPGSRNKVRNRSMTEERPTAERTTRSSQDDGESVDSHDHTHDASGDESDHLDFEGCHSAHLGNNKKKRKSSRFNSPTPPFTGTSDKSVQVHSLDSNSSATSASYVSIPAESATRSRVLADKTNISHQNAARASRSTEKPQSVPFAPLEPSFLRRDPVWRPPPRETIGDKHRAAIRKRMRLRLAPILQQRKLDRTREEARVHEEQQARADALDKQAKTDADAQAAAAVAAEKRIPPKRTSKAGKRAQAIRGGSASAKPLTIAEIRARAAAASGVPASSSATAAKSKPASTPNSTASLDVATRTSSPSPAQSRSPAISRSSSVAGHPRMERNLSSISHPAPPKTAPPPPSKSAPASDFTFRMSSAVTIRLGEMRAQLDAATRELSDTTLCEDPRGIVRALGESMYLPQTHKTSSQPIHKTREDSCHPDVPGRLLDEQRAQIGTSEMAPAAAIAPRPQDKAPQGRRTSSTAVHKPTASPASTTKKANGRHKPSPPSHKHPSACKHGHTPPAPGTASALFTDADWICLFCEYELYYGAPPLMLRACRNRKKLVEKKRRPISARKKAGGKARGCEHTCHDHTSVSDDCHHHHHEHEHDHDHAGGRHGRHRDPAPRESGEVRPRDRCDCGNSIHSSDFDDEDDNRSVTCF